MRFKTISEARYYLKTHTKDYQQKLKIVRFRRFDVDLWAYAEWCWTVVMK